MDLLGQLHAFSPIYRINNHYEYKKIVIKFGYPFNDIIPYLTDDEIEAKRKKLDRFMNTKHSFTLLKDKIKMEM